MQVSSHDRLEILDLRQDLLNLLIGSERLVIDVVIMHGAAQIFAKRLIHRVGIGFGNAIGRILFGEFALCVF